MNEKTKNKFKTIYEGKSYYELYEEIYGDTNDSLINNKKLLQEEVKKECQKIKISKRILQQKEEKLLPWQVFRQKVISEIRKILNSRDETSKYYVRDKENIDDSNLFIKASGQLMQGKTFKSGEPLEERPLEERYKIEIDTERQQTDYEEIIKNNKLKNRLQLFVDDLYTLTNYATEEGVLDISILTEKMTNAGISFTESKEGIEEIKEIPNNNENEPVKFPEIKNWKIYTKFPITIDEKNVVDLEPKHTNDYGTCDICDKIISKKGGKWPENIFLGWKKVKDENIWFCPECYKNFGENSQSSMGGRKTKRRNKNTKKRNKNTKKRNKNTKKRNKRRNKKTNKKP